MSKVSVFNEWDPLEEIIVGTALGAQLPRPDISVHAIDFPEIQNISDIPSGPFPQRIIEETEEDLAQFVETLESLSVTVRRPDVQDHSIEIATPDWSTDGLYNYCPRDIILAIDDTIIEAPSPLRARYLETAAYKEIFIDYMLSGAKWISAPRPTLKDDSYKEPNGFDNCLNNNEPMFDAANVLRMGRDVLYLISNSGNELGARWLQNALGDEYKVHTCHNLYHHKHIDTTFNLLRPGLAIVNPERVNKENLPDVLRNWDLIWFDDVVDVGFETAYPLCSHWIAINFLMVNPSLAIIDERQKPLQKCLESYGIDAIPLRLRHPRVLGGGFHCATSDVRRRGTLESYS